jgi:hypothetical protein
MSAAPTDALGFYQRPLYKLLDAAFPKIRTSQGLFDVAAFATLIGLSHEGVYKWLRKDRISADGARKVIGAADGRITQEQMFPFVMG